MSKRFRDLHGAHTVLTVVALLTVVLSAYAYRDQQDRRRQVIPKAAKLSDLAAKTDAERAQATAFDLYGSEPLTAGSEVAIAPEQSSPAPPGQPLLPYYDFVTQVACGYDAVVVGDPTPLTVRINNKRTFLYTKHSVIVQDWLRPRSGPSNITVLTAGGTVNVAGEITRTTSGQEMDPGHRYLLLLKRLPGTGAFTVVGRPVTSEDKNWPLRIPSSRYPGELANSEVDFERFVQDVGTAAHSCKGGAQ